MIKQLAPLCIAALAVFSSCTGHPPKDESTSTTLPAATPSASGTIGLPDSSAGLQNATAVTLPSIPAAGNAIAGLNPAHGQPGHRCDIAVGAPLSSPAPQPQQSAVAPQSLPAQQPVNVGGGTVRLNPAHGQPGHDCAVQVGQPLKN